MIGGQAMPLPRHPEQGDEQWTAAELDAIEAYGRRVATMCAYIARETGGVYGVIAAQEIERRFKLLEKS